MEKNWLPILICAALLQSYYTCPQRDRIVFRDPVSSVHDSIVVMNGLMDKVAKSNVKNYFFDDKGFLVINNKRLDRVPKGDSTSFLGLMAVKTDLSKNECKKFLVLSKFLKRNFLEGCFRYDTYGMYFYVYKAPIKNNDNNFRNIVLYDERLINMTATQDAESFTVLDRQKDLLLLMPNSKNK